MALRKAGETRFIKADLTEHGIVFLSPKGVKNLNKVNKIASVLADKVGIDLKDIITEQFLTSKGELFAIRDNSRVSEMEAQMIVMRP